VNIGPVVSAENRLTNGNCVACSRGSTYFVEYLWIYWTDFCNLFTVRKCFTCRWWIVILFSDFSRDVAMATKSFVNVRFDMAHILSNISGYTGTDFWNLFTIWKLFMYRWWIYTFFQIWSTSVHVISEFTLLKRAIFAAMHPQFSYVTLVFRNESSVCIDDVFVPYFPICQGMLLWQPK